MKNKSIAVAVIVMVAALLVLGCGKSKTNELDVEAISVQFVKEVIRGGYNIVDTKELQKWIDEKKDMLIVDNMPYEKSYRKNHIPGAKQIEFPVPELEKIDDAKKNELIQLLGENKDKLIVFYCANMKCTRSHNGAMWAVKLGYKNVFRVPGGIVARKEAGLAFENDGN